MGANRVDADEEFRAYVDSRQRALRRAAYLMCGDWHAADDLVQTTLVKLYVAWGRVRKDSGPDNYAHRILANAVIDERRRPWHRELLSEDVTELVETVVPNSERDSALDLAAALRRLPARQRVTLVLRFWLDLSVQETAQLLDCTDGTVKSQTARGLRSMQGYMREAEPLTSNREQP